MQLKDLQAAWNYLVLQIYYNINLTIKDKCRRLLVKFGVLYERPRHCFQVLM